MGISTKPGAIVEIAQIAWTCEHGYFDERGPLGGTLIETTRHSAEGVIAWESEGEIGLMMLDKQGDFSGAIKHWRKSASNTCPYVPRNCVIESRVVALIGERNDLQRKAAQ